MHCNSRERVLAAEHGIAAPRRWLLGWLFSGRLLIIAAGLQILQCACDEVLGNAELLGVLTVRPSASVPYWWRVWPLTPPLTPAGPRPFAFSAVGALVASRSGAANRCDGLSAITTGRNQCPVTCATVQRRMAPKRSASFGRAAPCGRLAAQCTRDGPCGAVLRAPAGAPPLGCALAKQKHCLRLAVRRS